ncbi:phage head closure protein [Heyndrickxia oleronia]|uniref:phage head closure protein n=1 Tax=Heyndrickxia oleronia TaxID=38875 RepID=UPI00203D34A7|nr:phage head closure protein [Heyndrickxia oleronia]MCM3454405.1 phage head closure protein [Heyndrickxia oleronia]
MQPFKYNPNYNSGSFRHRITFLKPVSIEDELGQKEVQWVEYKKAWAMIKTLKGSEYVNAGSERATITSRFVIHYAEGITAEMRIKYNNRIFDIIEPPINDDEADKTLTILVKEKR